MGDASITEYQFSNLFPTRSRSETDLDPVTSTHITTSWIAMLGSLFSVISLFFIGMSFNSNSGKPMKIASVLLLIGLILAIVAPIYLMISRPNAVSEVGHTGFGGNEEESFFGRHSPDNGYHEYRWGGGIGWFMSLGAGILLLISLILIVSGGKQSTQRRPVRKEETMEEEVQQEQRSSEQQESREQEPRQ